LPAWQRDQVVGDAPPGAGVRRAGFRALSAAIA